MIVKVITCRPSHLKSCCMYSSRYYNFPQRNRRTPLHLWYQLPLLVFPAKVNCVIIDSNLLKLNAPTVRYYWLLRAVSRGRLRYTAHGLHVQSSGGIYITLLTFPAASLPPMRHACVFKASIRPPQSPCWILQQCISACDKWRTIQRHSLSK